MRIDQELIEEIGRCAADPLRHVRLAFPWGEPGELERFSGPHDWQADILASIGKHLRSANRYEPLKIAVSSGRGIGKSALISMVAHWAMSTCDDARVIVTANTETQLATKTWPEISKWFRRSINNHWWVPTATRICARDKAHADTWRIDRETWSENNVEAFRGLHNLGKRMVFIFDEAAGIPDVIWRAAEGSLTDENTEMIWLAFSNPSQNTGSFRECFGRLKHRWVTRQIDSRKVPGTNKEEIKRWIEDYGEDSDFCRVNVKGEFPRAGSTQFIAGDVVSEARKRQCVPTGFKVLSVDVARFGDDQTVIGLRQGLHFKVLEKLRGMDVVQVAQRVMYQMKTHVPRSTVIDGDGIGAGVVDIVKLYMAEWFKANAPCRLHEFHGGSSPKDPEMYFNRRAEVWGMMRDWLNAGQIPDDAELESDLTGPQYFFSNKNQIQLEKKEDMKKRSLASPDIGDTLAMSFDPNPAAKTRKEALTEVREERIAEAENMTEVHLAHLKYQADLKKSKGPVKRGLRWQR